MEIIKLILIAIVIASMLTVSIDGYSLYKMRKDATNFWDNYKKLYGITMSVRLIFILATFYLLYSTN